MTRQKFLRLLTALAILVGSVLVTLNASPRLGLDLRGGTQIVLETSDSDVAKADAEATDRTLEVLRGRVDALGVAEPTLVRSGTNRIIVELPGVQDPREAVEVIGKTAQLSFRPVLGYADDPNQDGDTTQDSDQGSDQESDQGEASKDPDTPPTTDKTPDGATPSSAGELTLPDEDGIGLRLGPVAVPGDQVTAADAVLDSTNGAGWVVTVDFRGAGRQQWKDLTGQAACYPDGDPSRRVAIVLDDQVISSPQVVTDIACNVGMSGGSTQITGNFTGEEAQNLAVLIEGGALPVPVEVVEQRTVGPTLGKAAIDASWKAGVIGLVLTGLFIIFIYRLSGLLATVALAGYAAISYAALALLGATLTLPGLAGFVLAIGMAIDANVLVFERAKDEMAAADAAGSRADVSKSLTSGFKFAWSAIIDSNVTTLLAAGLLFFLASGPVKGFGVTLTIGVLASMISALVVARILTEAAVSTRWVRRRPKLTGLTAGGRVRQWLVARNPNIMGRSKTWIVVSVAAMAVSVAGIVLNGLNLGVEFTGGRSLEYTAARAVDVDTARAAVADAGHPNAVVQEADGGIAVRTGQLSDDEAHQLGQALKDLESSIALESDEMIGPSMGEELRSKALIAFLVALGAQMLYLTIRFRWVLGASAVIAMFHDVLIVTGVFAWLGKPIDGVFLAAVLSIIGLSVNDSVVVFDRVREVWKGEKKSGSFATACNDAVLATVPRTVNTGLGAMFILAALALLGGDSLMDFAVALLIGLTVGTYSSVFFGTPLAVLMHARWPVEPKQVRREKPRRDPADSGAVL